MHRSKQSVVDKNCKVHELDNTYAAHGSIMSTSGDTNSSLTIGANALQVADAIDHQTREKVDRQWESISKT